MTDPTYREKVRAQVKAYQAANYDKLRAKQREYVAANRDKINARLAARLAKPKVFNGQPAPLHETSYLGAHKRLQYYRGMASLYQCFCGRQALDWAWCHVENEHTRHGLHDGTEFWYSLSVWDYFALCRSCHKQLDLNGFMLHDRETI